MITMVSEGLAVYKQCLAKYLKKSEKIKKKNNILGVSDPFLFSTEDFNYLKGESSLLEAMEKVLKITKREQRAIRKEVVER